MVPMKFVLLFYGRIVINMNFKNILQKNIYWLVYLLTKFSQHIITWLNAIASVFKAISVFSRTPPAETVGRPWHVLRVTTETQEPKSMSRLEASISSLQIYSLSQSFSQDLTQPVKGGWLWLLHPCWKDIAKLQGKVWRYRGK